MLEGLRIAVIVPALNESKHIRRVVQTMPTFVDDIWLVDDGSEDDTAAQASTVGDSRLRTIRHSTPRGVGGALCNGYTKAFEFDADIAAVMAGDGQMDPDDLSSILAPLVRGQADYCKGNRLSHPQIKSRMPWTRLFGNQILSFLTRRATGLPLTDSQCGYTALTRAAASRLPMHLLWHGYGYPNDLLGWAATVRLRVVDVPVQPVYGDEISGVRLHHAVGLVPALLVRVLWRRMTHTILRPNWGPN